MVTSVAADRLDPMDRLKQVVGFDPLAFRIAAARVVEALADGVGLGKTIETGLVVRELKLRGLVASDENIWRQFDQVVCPVESIKPLEHRRGWTRERIERYNQERLGDLIAAGWDLIVVDEAHRLVTNANFGPLIAYLVPGATVLLGFSQFSPTLRGWFGAGSLESPTIGGFLYLTTASIAVGMTVSALRWALVDTIHSCTGLPLPKLDFSRLGQNVDAYALLIEIHYRHYLFYLFYANMFVATGIAYRLLPNKPGRTLALGLAGSRVPNPGDHLPAHLTRHTPKVHHPRPAIADQRFWRPNA
jgi:hypothetical protein